MIKLDESVVTIIRDVSRVLWILLSAILLYVVVPMKEVSKLNTDCIQALELKQAVLQETQSNQASLIQSIASDVSWLVRERGGTPAASRE